MQLTDSSARHIDINEKSSLDSINLVIDQFENSQSQELVSITASISAWPLVPKILSRMRSASLPALVKILSAGWACEIEELTYIVQRLREFDQLTLHNLLELLSDFLPKDALDALSNESRIELKSFQEWVVASHDSRLHKYPVLPWRSFIRKVNAENYDFARSVLDLFFMYGADAPDSPELKKILSQFLDSKKKVLCLFPKKWSREQ